MRTKTTKRATIVAPQASYGPTVSSVARKVAKNLSETKQRKLSREKKVRAWITATYLLENNWRMTPAETIAAVKRNFNRNIDRQEVYAYRSFARKLALMSPHDKGAHLTAIGVSSGTAALAKLN